MLIVRPLVESVFKKALARLPREERARLLLHLIYSDVASYDDFLVLARRFNVDELSVRGDAGTFRSTTDDASILGVYARTGAWAPETTALLRSFFGGSERGTYIDIGANIGLTTIPIARNPGVRCIAIEPEPTNFRNLERNIAANGPFENITALQMAVSFERATVEFELATGNLGDHRLRTTVEPGALREHERPTIEVQAATLDELAPSIEGPLAIKIDTQGAEPFVIAGGKKTLDRAGLLIMEFWPYGMKRLGGNVEELIGYLERNFQITHVLREGKGPESQGSHAVTIADLRTFAVSKSGDEPFYFDIVATRNSVSGGNG